MHYKAHACLELPDFCLHLLNDVNRGMNNTLGKTQNFRKQKF